MKVQIDYYIFQQKLEHGSESLSTVDNLQPKSYLKTSKLKTNSLYLLKFNK